MTDPVDVTLSRLAAHADAERAAFTAGYHPTSARILGVPTGALRAIARQLRDETRGLPLAELLALAQRLIATEVHEGRQVAYELLAAHRGLPALLTRAELEVLGQGMDNWVSVDTFSCSLAGGALRAGGLQAADLLDWARSPDRWWRRAALVTTTGWNKRSHGGRGDVPRTLLVCRALVADRDEFVVKALSWALRDLVVWDPGAVRAFLEAEPVAARVKREVTTKLETGRKGGVRMA